MASGGVGDLIVISSPDTGEGVLLGSKEALGGLALARIFLLLGACWG